MNKKTIITGVIAFIIGFGLAMTISIINDRRKQEEFDNYNVLFEVKIENDYINVRKGSSLGNKKIYEVLQGETYQVIDTYESKQYTWYKIKFGMRRTGWIASPKDEAWVTIIED